VDYIELTKSVLQVDPTGYFIGAVFALIGICFAVSFFSEHAENNLMTTSFMVAFLGGAVACFIGPSVVEPKPNLGAEIQHRSERADQLQAEIEKLYGLELTELELSKLNYPDEKPTVDFEAFGTFDRTELTDDDSILRQEITLVWKDGEMILAQSEDGENFTPIEPTN